MWGEVWGSVLGCGGGEMKFGERCGGKRKCGERCQVSAERCEGVLRAVWVSVRGEVWKVWREVWEVCRDVGKCAGGVGAVGKH